VSRGGGADIPRAIVSVVVVVVSPWPPRVILAGTVPLIVTVVITIARGRFAIVSVVVARAPSLGPACSRPDGGFTNASII
jgi:hypothetical protein